MSGCIDVPRVDVGRARTTIVADKKRSTGAVGHQARIFPIAFPGADTDAIASSMDNARRIHSLNMDGRVPER